MCSTISMPSWAWVVTAEILKPLWFCIFQCPHGLELLPNNYDEILEINLFQCPHGLELLPIFITICKLVVMFQCPHGLELLQENIRKTKRQLRVSMPLWAWVVTSWKEYIWHLKLFQCPYGLELLRKRKVMTDMTVSVSMPLWAWVVTSAVL